MFDRLIRLIDRVPLWLLGVVGLGLVSLIGLADYLSGAQLSFSVFYLLPIALVAWRTGRSWPYSFSIASAILWYLANLPGYTEMGFSRATMLWNVLTRLGFFVVVASLVGSLRRVLDRERARANTDPLTGLLNSRGFYEAAEQEIERARRYARPVSMLYLDLDGFKQLNDRHGHAAGDRALQTLGATLAANVRASDIVARLGGDEFGVVLPEAGVDAARAAAAKLQRKVTEGFAQGDARLELALCLGVATFLQPPGSIDQLVGAADQLMYAAKRSGPGSLVQQVVGGELELS